MCNSHKYDILERKCIFLKNTSPTKQKTVCNNKTEDSLQQQNNRQRLCPFAFDHTRKLQIIKTNTQTDMVCTYIGVKIQSKVDVYFPVPEKKGVCLLVYRVDTYTR